MLCCKGWQDDSKKRTVWHSNECDQASSPSEQPGGVGVRSEREIAKRRNRQFRKLSRSTTKAWHTNKSNFIRQNKSLKGTLVLASFSLFSPLIPANIIFSTSNWRRYNGIVGISEHEYLLNTLSAGKGEAMEEARNAVCRRRLRKFPFSASLRINWELAGSYWNGIIFIFALCCRLGQLAYRLDSNWCLLTPLNYFSFISSATADTKESTVFNFIIAAWEKCLFPTQQYRVSFYINSWEANIKNIRSWCNFLCGSQNTDRVCTRKMRKPKVFMEIIRKYCFFNEWYFKVWHFR